MRNNKTQSTHGAADWKGQSVMLLRHASTRHWYSTINSSSSEVHLSQYEAYHSPRGTVFDPSVVCGGFGVCAWARGWFSFAGMWWKKERTNKVHRIEVLSPSANRENRKRKGPQITPCLSTNTSTRQTTHSHYHKLYSVSHCSDPSKNTDNHRNNTPPTHPPCRKGGSGWCGGGRRSCGSRPTCCWRLAHSCLQSRCKGDRTS